MTEPLQLKPTGADELSVLAGRIKTAHAAVLEASKGVVQKAISAGTALREAKSKLPHGQWLPWLQEHCSLSGRTAHRYMQLAANRGRVEAKLATMANMTLVQALKLLGPDRVKGEDAGPSAKYDKAQAALLKKLGDLLPEDVEDAAQQTISELEKVAAAVRAPVGKAA